MAYVLFLCLLVMIGPQDGVNRSSNVVKRVFVGRVMETPDGSRQTIKSDNPLGDYSAYRSGDRFHVVIPNSEATALGKGGGGRGFSDMQVQQRGKDVVLSYRLRPGAKPRVEQVHNRLDVVVEVYEIEEESSYTSFKVSWAIGPVWAPAARGAPYSFPIKLSGLSKALKLKGLTIKEIVAIVSKRGVGFDVTSETEAFLREAGADSRLIRAIKSSRRREMGRGVTLSIAVDGTLSDYRTNESGDRFYVSMPAISDDAIELITDELLGDSGIENFVIRRHAKKLELSVRLLRGTKPMVTHGGARVYVLFVSTTSRHSPPEDLL